MTMRDDAGRDSADGGAGDRQALATFLRRLQWGLVALAAGWLLWLLSPVLTPFVFAAMLGWLGDPLVDRMQARGMPRNGAVVVVFAAMSAVALLALLLLLPLLQQQLATLFASLPHYREWLVGTALPWIEAKTGLELVGWLDPARLFALVRSHWEQAGGAAATLLGYLSRSGFALLGWIANLVLLPVLTFFFLRDWDVFVERAAALVPRDHAAVAARLARESSDVLGGFLRGQLLVMLALGVLYAGGLLAVGLDLGILVGVLAGLLTFVPYLGPTTVVVLGGVAALAQFGDWQHLVGVGVVFAVGQVIESYWLTPKLVGDRIGLHPVAVIFSVLAGGTLFGFLGMLLALPVAAVANVLLRYAHERYLHSRLYAGQPEAAPIVVAEAGPPSLPAPPAAARPVDARAPDAGQAGE
jgi:predicted PurR-regulated permease PerM